jgi:hypothetical protein
MTKPGLPFWPLKIGNMLHPQTQAATIFCQCTEAANAHPIKANATSRFSFALPNESPADLDTPGAEWRMQCIWHLARFQLVWMTSGWMKRHVVSSG